jgi:hypothetical protein
MLEHTQLLPRYQQLRQVGVQLSSRLFETLSKSVLDEGGKKLGILKKNVLVLDTEDEIAVLADYCIHDVRRQGANAVDQYLAKSPPPADSDEMVLLLAQQHAWFSLFAVEAAERGVGIHVRDLLRQQLLFLVDVGLSRTARLGMVLAARVMAPEGIPMTTGAALPVGVLSADEMAQFVQGMVDIYKGVDFRHLDPKVASDLTATIIRLCLDRGAAEHIAYRDPRPGSGPGRALAASPARRHVGRNEPCPCGSGKKFKHCCGARG